MVVISKLDTEYINFIFIGSIMNIISNRHIVGISGCLSSTLLYLRSHVWVVELGANSHLASDW